jgi:arylsulfatase A-like enzyme
LLTGRYQQRCGHELNPGPAHLLPPNVGLPVTETTIGDCFRAAGDKTGWFGKSHLGYAPQFHNLSLDIGEKENLAEKNPAKLRELVAVWETYNRQMLEPLWPDGSAERGTAPKDAKAPSAKSN